MKKLFIVLVLLVLASGCTVQRLPEPSPGTGEVGIIKTDVFKQFLYLSVSPHVIDDNGAAGRNLEGFLEVSTQRVAAKMIMRGIAHDDEGFVEKGMKAIEYGFAHQNEDGSFQYDPRVKELGANDADLLEAGAFFMQAVGHSYLLLNQSRFSEKYRERLSSLEPNIRSALSWLGNNRQTLLDKARHAPNRLVFDGLAFKLNGIILGDEDYQSIGDEFIRENLNTQRDDGVFVEHGGHDSSYQAVSLFKLQIYWMYSDEGELRDRIASSVEKGMLWEKARIKDTGEVDVTGNTRTGNCQETFLGKCKDVSYPEVIMGFLYYAGISGEKEFEALAEKVMSYAVSIA